MVKGISRRVVVVRPPESTAFEQAIFIMRESAPPSRDALHEACEIARQYLSTARVRRYSRKRWTNVQLALSALSGGLMVGFAWVLTALLY